MKWKRAVCAIVAAGMLMTPVYAAQFNDTSGHWAKASIDRWSDYGIIAGYPGNNFGPNNSITRGQMAVMLDRLFGWQQVAQNNFKDISGSEWYAKSVLRANAAGVMVGSGGYASPNAPITRQEAAVMISRALRASGSDTGKVFGDSSQISAWAVEAINAMSQRGFISGSDDGNLYPKRGITRAETVAILDRAIANYYNKAGSYSADAAGITLIAAPGVTLKNMTVDGDLFIAPGANNSEVILQNVTVTGKTYIQSGSGAEVIVSGTHLAGIHVEGSGARVQFQDHASYASLTVSGDGARLRGLDANAQVTVTDGTEGVVLNGHSVSSGTVRAGQDISTDDDDVDVDFDIIGGSTGGGNSDSSVDEDGNIIIDFGDLFR